MLLSTQTPPHKHLRHPPTSITTTPPTSWFSDSRDHGSYKGPSRFSRTQRVVLDGGGSLASCPDGSRVAVAGATSLKILKPTESSRPHSADGPKSSSLRPGTKISVSKNLWEGSGLKLDSASTDVVWCNGSFEHKLLTSARNGEIIMWDLNKNGSNVYERRTKDHLRSIHQLAISKHAPNYCITGSADGDMRVWDIRDLSKSIMRIKHPTTVRSVAFSPSSTQPLHAIAGLDNGSIYRWDLKMGQRGALDRLAVAHTGSVTALDWASFSSNTGMMTGKGGAGGGASPTASPGVLDLGWLVSGGLDRIVKVWDLTSSSHMPSKPTYTLHPSFSIRSVSWRPDYECEIAIVSNAEFSTSGSNPDLTSAAGSALSSSPLARSGLGFGGGGGLLQTSASAHDLSMLANTGRQRGGASRLASLSAVEGLDLANSKGGGKRTMLRGDAIEVWDVRQAWVAKWAVEGSAVEGGVTDIAFRDSHTLWAQHVSGAFSQFDMRECIRPIDAVPSSVAAWEACGSLTFATNTPKQYEIPYDDISLNQRANVSQKWKLKAIGDRPHSSDTQCLGTFVDEHSSSEVEVFSALANRYTLEGVTKSDTCAFNAELAWEVGNAKAAQAWELLQTLLTDLVPEDARPPQAPRLAHSVSAPPLMTTTPTDYTFPALGPEPIVTSNSGPPFSQGPHHNTPSHTPNQSRRPSASPLSAALSLSKDGSLPLTPLVGNLTRSSSNSTTSISPRKKLSPLPAIISLPPVLSDRRPSLEPRPSLDSARSMSTTGSGAGPGNPPPLSLSRRASKFRRPSHSTQHSASTSDKSFGSMQSQSQTRNLAEGALDDSDSDSDGEGMMHGDELSDVESSGAEDNGAVVADDSETAVLDPVGLPSLRSFSTSSRGPAQPSPLSRRWTEDEDDESATASSGRSYFDKNSATSTVPAFPPALRPGVKRNLSTTSGTSQPSHPHDTDEDHDDEDSHSASPRSTDTESGGRSSSPGRPAALSRRQSSLHSRRRSRRNSAAAIKQANSRNRSTELPAVDDGGVDIPRPGSGSGGVNIPLKSTAASLRPHIHKNDSGSSIRTIIAAAEGASSPLAEARHERERERERGLRAEGTLTQEKFDSAANSPQSQRAPVKPPGSGEHNSTPNTKERTPHRHHHSKSLSKSVAISELLKSGSGMMSQRRLSIEELEGLPVPDMEQSVHFHGVGHGHGHTRKEDATERSAKVVKEEERAVRDMGWGILAECVRELADEGDVQTCAMITILAGKELKIKQTRLLRFVEAYIDLLSRLKLHVPSAYLRKLSELEDVSTRTNLETTIYTSCGKCKKPLVQAAGTAPLPGQPPKGGYASCLSCKTSCVKCAICRLPVRALLIQCPTCAHGGHQECYRAYYNDLPMVDIALSTSAGGQVGTPGVLSAATSTSGSASASSGSGMSSPAPTSITHSHPHPHPHPPPTTVQSPTHNNSAGERTTKHRSVSLSDTGPPALEIEGKVVFPSTSAGSGGGGSAGGSSHGAQAPGTPNRTSSFGMAVSAARGVGQKKMGLPCAAGCGHFCWASWVG